MNRMEGVPNVPALNQLPIVGDLPLRRQIQIELAELSDLVNQRQPRSPIEESIFLWINSFRAALRHPNPGQVLANYLPQLENILRNPVDPNSPFPPELFSDIPPPIVRRVIQHMMNVNSVLFSQLINQAAPQAAPVRAAVVEAAVQPALEDLEEGFALIAEIQARRDQEVLHNRARLQRLEHHVVEAGVRNRVLLGGIEQVAERAFQQIQEDVEGIRLAGREERERLIAGLERLENGAQLAREEIRPLQARLDNAGQILNELERENIQLQIQVTRLKETINERKAEWLNQVIIGAALIVVSVTITWISGGSIPPGTTLQIFKGAGGVTMAGVAIPL